MSRTDEVEQLLIWSKDRLSVCAGVYACSMTVQLGSLPSQHRACRLLLMGLDGCYLNASCMPSLQKTGLFFLSRVARSIHPAGSFSKARQSLSKSMNLLRKWHYK